MTINIVLYESLLTKNQTHWLRIFKSMFIQDIVTKKIRRVQ
jgi:hypothetical protein